MSWLKTECKNKTRAWKAVRLILDEFKINSEMTDIRIKELIKYHPTKDIDFSRVDYFSWKPHKSYKKPTLYFKYKDCDEEDDISLKVCVANLYEKFDLENDKIINIKKAFRNESRFGTHMDTQLANKKTTCPLCNKQAKLTCDHYPISWKQIFTEFCENKNIILGNVEIFEGEDGTNYFNDEMLSLTWTTYHDSRATYRMICNSCNASAGSHGY